jgi:hypothetical protein
VPHPDWLQKRLLEKLDPFKQQKLGSFFKAAPKPDPETIFSELSLDDETASSKGHAGLDMEDMGGGARTARSQLKMLARVTKHKKRRGGNGIAVRLPEDPFSKQALERRQDVINWEHELPANPGLAHHLEWLSWKKKQWKMQRAERARKRSLGIMPGSMAMSGSKSGRSPSLMTDTS